MPDRQENQINDTDVIAELSLEDEEWRSVVGYEGIYIVSSLGRVMNILKAERRVPYKILRPLPTKANYLSVCLYRDKKMKRHYIHRLVAEAFIPNPIGCDYVDHINTLRHDNRVGNLRWVSAKQNLSNPLTKKHISQSARGDYEYCIGFVPEQKQKRKRKQYKYTPILSTEEFVRTNSKPSERWLPVVGMEESYLISDLGRVISLPKQVIHRGKPMYFRHRFLRPSVETTGYLRVCLNGKFFRIHRLIATAFIPNPDNKPYIDHINTIRTDNRIENLRWVTASENMQNPISVLRNTKSHIGKKQSIETIEKRISKIKGKRRSAEQLLRYKEAVARRGKPVCQYDIDNNLIAIHQSLAEASRRTGIRSSLICSCCKGMQHTAGGYIWKYKNLFSNSKNESDSAERS